MKEPPVNDRLSRSKVKEDKAEADRKKYPAYRVRSIPC